MGRIERSIHLVGASWQILGRGRDLVWLPVASAVAVGTWILLSLGVAFAIGADGRFIDFAKDDSFASFGKLNLADYLLVYGSLAGATFLTVFFNAAVVAAALERLADREASARDGLRVTWARRRYVLQWALFSATVGLAMWVVRSRGEWLGKVVGWFFEVAWGLATVFVAPVLVTRDLGPLDALKSSASLLRETWGENIVKDLGLGLITFAAILCAAFIVLPFGLTFGMVPGLVVLGIAVAVIVAAISALDSVFNAALYTYATTGAPPPSFAGLDLGEAFVKKGRKR